MKYPELCERLEDWLEMAENKVARKADGKRFQPGVGVCQILDRHGVHEVDVEYTEAS